MIPSNKVESLSFSGRELIAQTQVYSGAGFRIGQAAHIAFFTLTSALGLGTAALAVRVFLLPTPWTITVLVITSLAFILLFTAKILSQSKISFSSQWHSVINYVRATAVDILAKIACAILYLVKQTPFDPKAGDCDSKQTPILLVHGYLHNSSAWTYFRYRLKVAGYHNVFTIDLGNPFSSIESYAEKVEKKLKDIRTMTGRNDIHLMGHSMGGVVCSYFAAYMAKNNEIDVKTVTTLGSPLEGTKLRGIGACTKQMRYRSAFIESLRKKVFESDITFYHVGSEADLIIRPVNSAIVKKHRYTMFKNLGHVSYLFSDRVIQHCLLFYSQQA